MNRSIARLFVVVIALFTILIVWTSRWSVFDQQSLNDNPLNQISFYESLKVRPGRILADDGAVLAKPVRAAGGVWGRRYPYGPLFAQAVGYANPREGQYSGIELTRKQELAGTLRTGLSSVFGPLSTPSAGDDVYTTLDPRAQALARTELDGRVGSVVAIVPQTGAIKAMYSNPAYNDNNDPSSCRTSDGCSLVNDAVDSYLPPGSTFKVVTTTAALDSGKFTPSSEINAPGELMVSGAPLHNDIPGNLGEVSLTYALTNSINTVFAQVGERVGAATMQTYMKRYGFYSIPPLDYPADEMTASGPRVSAAGRLLAMTSPQVDLGRTSIGQAKLLVTPLQMAMVAATVANGGKLMEPRLTSKVVAPDGTLVEQFSPQQYAQVMKPSVAHELTQMMTDVVEEGTGQAAQLDGVQVAGKTGTASTGGYQDGEPLDDAWFIGFAPIDHPRVAVAVELSNLQNGYGGTYAAPIAAQEIKLLLSEKQ